ncbi:MAG: hypothetical protein PF961_21080 [Planctomycetota bacterium]|jgi:hypothetical protein|nr:hypothetical protein [Planctomycetota bacterium]
MGTYFLMILFLCLSCMVVAGIGQQLRIPSVAFGRFGFHRPSTVLLLRLLAGALAARAPLGPVLEGATIQMPLLYRQRLRRAAEALETGDTLSDVVMLQRLLPPDLARGFQAAEDLGPEALRQWCVELAEDLESHTDGPPMQAYVVPVLVVLTAVTGFVCVFIVPKFEKIFDEFGIRLGWVTEQLLWAVRVFGIPALIAVPVLALVIGNWSWLAHYCMPSLRRLYRGRLLVHGAHAGCSEKVLATCLAASFARPPSGLLAAGENGDFPAVAAACGWRAADAAALTSQIDRAVMRRRWRQLCLDSALRLGLPVILGIPVLFVCYGLFHPLVLIVTKLVEL